MKIYYQLLKIFPFFSTSKGGGKAIYKIMISLIAVVFWTKFQLASPNCSFKIRWLGAGFITCSLAFSLAGLDKCIFRTYM